MQSSNNPYDNHGAPRRINGLGHDAKFDQETFLFKNPIPEDLKPLIRADFKENWHRWRDTRVREDTRRRWITLDTQRMVLEDSVGEVSLSKIKYLCNKPTAFYLLQSAQRREGLGATERTGIPPWLLRAIYEEWSRCYNSEPNIEHQHFFASPVRVTRTGPSAVSEIIKAHHSICTQASDLLRGTERSDLQYYTILPLYRSIVVIMDSLNSDEILRERDSDGLVSLRKVAQHFTVLIARTGVEEGLSGPVSFECLKSQALPLKITDASAVDIDVMRVPLDVAVQFIIGLEKRENDAFPKEIPLEEGLHPGAPKGFKGMREVNGSPETWANACLEAAEKYGLDDIHTFETVDALRRILGILDKESAEPPLWHSLFKTE